MPTFTRKPAEFPQGQIEGLSTGGEAFGASFGETWETGPSGAADMFQRLQASESLSVGERLLDPLFGIESRKLSPMVAPDDAKQRVKDAGLDGQIPLAQYPNGLRSDTLQILIDANTAKVRRQTIMQQADGWAPQLGGMLVGSLIDPINVASAFIPVVGEARYAQLLSRAGGAVGRGAVRVGVGAAEGAVGAAVVEPLIYAGQQQWRNDYDAFDSLLNVAGGAAFGALLHAGAGLAKDVFGRPVTPVVPERIEPADAPGVDLGRPVISETGARVRSVSVEPEIVRTGEPVGLRTKYITGRDIDSFRENYPDGVEFSAKTKKGEFVLFDRSVDADDPVRRVEEFSEFGQVREVIAFDGDGIMIGNLIYANDGTPPTIQVSERAQRQGVATAMLKAAKEQGGLLGDPNTGVSGVARPGYRTDAGHAFRTGADESTVDLVRHVSAPAKPIAPGAFGDAQTGIGRVSKRTVDLEAIRKSATEGGFLDMGSAANKITTQVEAALNSGERVTLYADGKPIEITGVERGMMADSKGQRWGVLSLLTGDGKSNRIDISPPPRRPAYRTDEGQAFRTGADEGSVELTPRMAAPAQPIDPGTFGDGAVRPFIAELDPQTQANALRQAVAQDVQGRPVDVTPAMLADPRFVDDPTAHSEAMARAVANSSQMASADPQASIVAEQSISQTTEKGSALEQAKQALADDETRFREEGGDPDAVDFEGEDTRMIQDAVKAATLCMMRSGA